MLQYCQDQRNSKYQGDAHVWTSAHTTHTPHTHTLSHTHTTQTHTHTCTHTTHTPHIHTCTHHTHTQSAPQHTHAHTHTHTICAQSYCRSPDNRPPWLQTIFLRPLLLKPKPIVHISTKMNHWPRTTPVLVVRPLLLNSHLKTNSKSRVPVTSEFKKPCLSINQTHVLEMIV